MKTLEIRGAVLALLIASAALGQPAQPPAAPPLGAPGSGGPRGMPASQKARSFDSKSLGASVTYVAYLPADYETSWKNWRYARPNRPKKTPIVASLVSR